jgi:hypothetical protein
VEKLSEDDPWLRSLDLSYHLLDREHGLFFALMDQGAFRLPYLREEITCHSLCPPSTTRAAVRGRCIEKFGSAVNATQWDYLMLQGAEKKIELDLRNLFDAHLVRQSLKSSSSGVNKEICQTAFKNLNRPSRLLAEAAVATRRARRKSRNRTPKNCSSACAK